jgi:regulator of sigma E protease
MNETLLTWIVFILAFGGMIVVHEFGHFIAARMSDIEVEEFGIGFPTPGAVAFWISAGYFFLKNGRRVEIPKNFRMPVLWNDLVDREVKLTVDETDGRTILRSIQVVLSEEVKQTSAGTNRLDEVFVNEKGEVIDPPANVARSMREKLITAGNTTGSAQLTDIISEVHPGTRFTINWLPIGGFVRPKGENDPNVKGGMAAASPWRRLFVLVSGPAMNLLTAVAVISLIIALTGGIISVAPNQTGPMEILITEVVSNSPAEAGGLQTGDIIVAGNGVRLTDDDEASDLIKANPGIPIVLTVLRNGEELDLTVTPRMNEKAGRPLIGVSMCGGCEFKPITSITENIQYSLKLTGAQIYALLTMPVRLIEGSIPREQGRLVGLKGIFDIMEQSVSNDVESSQTNSTTPSSAANPYNKPVATLSLIAVLSISLGIFNLFPFPALDGGRILFLLPELFFRRRVPPYVENLVHGVGMALLLLLMLYVNVRDFIDPAVVNFP